MTLPQLLRHVSSGTPTHTRVGDVMGVAEAVGEVLRVWLTPLSPPLEVAQPLHLRLMRKGRRSSLGTVKVKAVKLRL